MKKALFYLIGLCCGIVAGTLVAELTASTRFFRWLSYGLDFGMTEPFVLDLSVIRLTFGVTLDLNIAVVIFTVIALLITRKLYRD